MQTGNFIKVVNTTTDRHEAIKASSVIRIVAMSDTAATLVLTDGSQIPTNESLDKLLDQFADEQ